MNEKMKERILEAAGELAALQDFDGADFQAAIDLLEIAADRGITPAGLETMHDHSIAQEDV